MRGTHRWLSIAAIGVIAAFAIYGCGGSDDTTSGSTSGGGEDLGLITDGTLLVGADTPYPPFEIGQPPDITGFDVEVMNAIADQLGVTPEYQDTGFPTIFRDVAAGQFDTAVAASTITPGRQQTVDFSDPYYTTQQALMVPEGSDITSVDDLSGKIVGAQDGTTGETYANDNTDAAEVRGFPEGPDAISAMISGQVDAAMIDQQVAVDAIKKQSGIEIAQLIPTDEFYGFAMSKDNPALVEAMDSALQAIKKDGTLTDIYQKYFQSDPPKSVLEGTTDNPS